MKRKTVWRKNDLAQVEETLERKEKHQIEWGNAEEFVDDVLVLDVQGSGRRFGRTLTIDEILRPKSAVRPLTKRKAKQRKEQAVKLLPKIQGNAIKQKAKDDYYTLWNDEQHQLLTETIKSNAPTAWKAVRIDHAGISYNPKASDHKELIALAVEEEMERLHEQEIIKSQLPNREATKPLDPLVEFYRMQDEASDVGEQFSDNETAENIETKKKKSERKTRAQRNKQERFKRLVAQQDKKRREKALFKQINKLKELEKEINSEEKTIQQRTEKRKLYRMLTDKLDLKRLGRRKLERPFVSVQLTEELSMSLRGLKPEGSLLKERYWSFLERGLVEPSGEKPRKRRYKLKNYEVRSYKEFE